MLKVDKVDNQMHQMTIPNFPFSAIVDQPQLKTALLLCAIDPTLGGVLIRGDKGTSKSTAACALPERFFCDIAARDDRRSGVIEVHWICSGH